MANLTRKQKLAKFAKAAEALEAMAADLGFIGVTSASVERDTTRSAITQLITRRRLEPVYVFGSPQLLLDDVKGFKKEKPGPKVEQD